MWVTADWSGSQEGRYSSGGCGCGFSFGAAAGFTTVTGPPDMRR
jgi:hypothetical protein